MENVTLFDKTFKKSISYETISAAIDKVADQIFDKFCDYLGYSLAATAAVIDPEIFILGGGVSKAGQVMVDRVQAYFVKYAWPGIRGIKFALAELGNDAGIYGAASIAIGK